MFDFALNFASSLTAAIDRGVAITVLAGIHAGCFGLFGHEVIRGIADLKGRSVAVGSMGSPAHLPAARVLAMGHPSPPQKRAFAGVRIEPCSAICR